jgi:hypothetical protein
MTKRPQEPGGTSTHRKRIRPMDRLRPPSQAGLNPLDRVSEVACSAHVVTRSRPLRKGACHGAVPPYLIVFRT